MKASDLILHIKTELNEKREGWSDEELFVKLQRSYVALQFDLPFFITKESLAIQSGISDYYLQYTPLKNVHCLLNNEAPLEYMPIESFYINNSESSYTFDLDQIVVGFTPQNEGTLDVVYRYGKKLETINCEIETPSIYDRALRLLVMADIHEKPVSNTEYRDMSVHYLKLYEAEVKKQKLNSKLRSRNITSNYQRI